MSNIVGEKGKMLAETRIVFASKWAYECMKNPEAVNSFICSVAETVNITDIHTINSIFYQALAITQKQKEQNQKN